MILVIEDDLHDVFLLVHELERAGLEDEVRILRNGRDARDLLLQMSPEPYAVFLDLKLPGMSGIELLREIRNEPRLYSLPVIVTTSSIDPGDAATCARLGVAAFLAKPVQVHLFRMIIECARKERTFLARPVDPHFADLASAMLV
jgi:CheY-like chemotaxis protein